MTPLRVSKLLIIKLFVIFYALFWLFLSPCVESGEGKKGKDEGENGTYLSILSLTRN